MQAYIILGGLLGLPLLLGILFRVSAPHLFFALLAGELLERYFGEDMRLIANSFVKNDDVSQYAKVGVLLLPMVLTAVFLKKSISGGKLLLHLLPLAVTGIVAGVFALPLLPENLQNLIYATEAGQTLRDMADAIIAAMVLLQLISLWVLNKSSEKHKKRKLH